MRKDQCCVSVGTNKVPNFLDGEAKHGRTKYAFGGRTETGNDKSIKLLQLI